MKTRAWVLRLACFMYLMGMATALVGKVIGPDGRDSGESNKLVTEKPEQDPRGVSTASVNPVKNLPATACVLPVQDGPRWASTDTDQEQPVLPDGWRLEDIAKATPSFDDPAHVYVLAWQMTTNDKSNYIDECLVLCESSTEVGKNRWHLEHLIRDPSDKKGGEWMVSMYHRAIFGSDGRLWGEWVDAIEAYDKAPSNKEIYAFTDKHYWSFRAEYGYKLIATKVCEKAWELVVKEKPARFFLK
jgi:hypothetical protein